MAYSWITWVEVIAAIESWRNVLGIGGVLNGFLEVNDGVERPASADPPIYRFTLHFLCFGEIAGENGADEWREGGAVDLDAVFVGAVDQLL